MSISDKIDEIRRKPEHIRMRYVLAGVCISMFFIIIIWIFSLSETMSRSAIKKPNIEPLNDQFNQSLENMPSIEEFMDQGPATVEPGSGGQTEEIPGAVENGTSQENNQNLGTENATQ